MVVLDCCNHDGAAKLCLLCWSQKRLSLEALPGSVKLVVLVECFCSVPLVCSSNLTACVSLYVSITRP